MPTFKSRLRWRLAFWIMLGVLSTYIAEVLSGSDAKVFFHIFGWLGVFPLYALHTLLLAFLVFNNIKRPSVRSFYLAGTLFGMYEAYITKVLWNPPWNSNPVRIGGVSLIEVLMLVFFWHAVMSFMLPLLWGENLFTESDYLIVGLNQRIRQVINQLAFVIGLGIYSGVTLSSNQSEDGNALFFSLACTLFVSTLLVIWKSTTRKFHFDLVKLLPRKKEAVILAILLASYYIYFGISLRPEALPGLGAQLTIWVLYATLISLLIFSLHKDKTMEKIPPTTINRFTMKEWSIFCISFLVTALVCPMLPEPLQRGLAVLAWLGGMAVGTASISWSVISLLRKTKKEKATRV